MTALTRNVVLALLMVIAAHVAELAVEAVIVVELVVNAAADDC